MLYVSHILKFLTVLLDIQSKIQTSEVEKQGIVFNSANPVHGPCPGSFSGDIRRQNKCIVVVQEWWGMNEQIKDQAKNISKDGDFVTLVPDLYRGRVATTPVLAFHFTKNLNYHGGVDDVQAAARYLLASGCKKVGVTGFCMGGAFSLAAAAKIPEISAAVAFYGIPSESVANVSDIKIPIQLHFGRNDTSSVAGPAGYNKLIAKLNAAGVNYEPFLYNAGHAFTNRYSQNYDEDIAKLSIGRMINFFNKNLG